MDHLTTQAPDHRTVTPASEVDALRKQIRRYRAAMEHVVDELQEDFDTVDGGDGQPAPNKAMRLAHELEEAIYGPGGY